MVLFVDARVMVAQYQRLTLFQVQLWRDVVTGNDLGIL